MRWKFPLLACVILIAASFIGLSTSGNDISYVSNDTEAGVWAPKILNLTKSHGGIVGNNYNDFLHYFDSHGIGDVNGDGFDDFAVGASRAGNGGEIYLIFGRGAGLPNHERVGNGNVKFIPEPGDRDYAYVAGAGDVNGDGYGDILTVDFDYSSDNITNRGKAYLFFGRETDKWNSTIRANESDASFISEQSDALYGPAVGIGDVNGDGLDDIMIGAPRYSTPDLYQCGMTFLIFGKREGWSNHVVVNSSNVDASFHGEYEGDGLGDWVRNTRAGDVNNDGYSDILINSIFYNNSNTYYPGHTYLVLGKEDRWGYAENISEVCSGSFIGTKDYEYSGHLGSWGDINGDGFDDILIGDPYYNPDGRAYLFFGKGTPWTFRTNLTDADVTFIGGDFGGGLGPRAGFNHCILGDVNGDGYEDIAITAPWFFHNIYGRVGAVYVVFGRPADQFPSDFYLFDDSDILYLGERPGIVGWNHNIAKIGDINGDGFNDMVVSSQLAVWYKGEAYIVLFETAKEQKSTNSVTLYGDQNYTIPISSAMVGDRVYIELIGVDGNSTYQDQAFVKVTKGGGSTLPLMLKETGINTGVYQGDFVVGGVFDTFRRTYPCDTWDNLLVYATKDPSKNSSLLVDTWIDLYPDRAITSVLEGENFIQEYSTRGRNEAISWEAYLDDEIDWLSWDEGAHTLSGSPDNTDIKNFFIWINVTDDYGHTDSNYLYLYLFSSC